MKRKLLIASVCLFFVSVALPTFASNICTADPCTEAQVGVFMSGISQPCGNTGDCSINDIMQVFHNVGNYVLGIAGSLVLLMYVIGGIYMISARGSMEQVKKGIKYIQVSTVGLAIVFIAYAGVKTLENVLRGGSVVTTDAYVECGALGETHEGEPCAAYSRCSVSGVCVGECMLKNAEEERLSPVYWWACIDKDSPEFATWSLDCRPDLCPGDETVQCCYAMMP